MTALGIFCALLTLATAGTGLALLVNPRDETDAMELCGLAVIFGGAFVSAMLFVLGFVLHGPALTAAVSVCCVGTGLAGLRRARGIRWPVPLSAPGWFFCTLLTAQFCVIAWQTLNHPLNWDGLLSWEFKARLAFLGGGRIPAEYFSDPSRQWTHPNYPLCIPLVEYWFYAWIGRCDQGVAKLPFVFLYASGAALLFSGVKKISGESWRGALAALLMFFVPALSVEPGSTTSGWADAPLATVYLAAVIYLLEYAAEGWGRALLLCGVCAGILPWVKQEGAVLWACLLAVACCVAWRRGGVARVLMAVVPGIAVIVGWKLFLAFARVPPSTEFLPLRMETFAANIGRVPFIAIFLAWQIFNWRCWSALWIAMFFALWQLSRGSGKNRAALLAACIFLPVAVLLSAYIFSAWPDFRNHVATSLPRLLTDVSLVAVLSIALVFPSLFPGKS
jgi:hypothetical protein